MSGQPEGSHEEGRHEPRLTPSDVYAALAGRLGVKSVATVEGPVRNPLMGPGDEKPIEKLLRLSTQMEQLAAEIRSVSSATYRSQLWQQWAAIWWERPEYHADMERDAAGADASARSPSDSPADGRVRRTRGIRSRR